jgi:hypothetical protein
MEEDCNLQNTDLIKKTTEQWIDVQKVNKCINIPSSNYKIKPSLATTDKMYSFCALFDHNMFWPPKVAIFR